MVLCLQIGFEAVQGAGNEGDIAVDEIMVKPGKCILGYEGMDIFVLISHCCS